MTEPTLTCARLKELLHYDIDTGEFFWKISRGAGTKGEKAGYVNNLGYVCMSVDGRRYAGHRLAWFYVNGNWPEQQLDHINRVKTDNRIVNLREVSTAENNQNTSLLCNNTSGYRGVHWCKRYSKWEAKIKHNKRTRYLGRFEHAEDAYAAYLAAAAELHTHNPCVATNSHHGIKGGQHER